MHSQAGGEGGRERGREGGRKGERERELYKEIFHNDGSRGSPAHRLRITILYRMSICIAKTIPGF
jgi:hypothetical protein